MTPEKLARLHADCFTTPAPWTAPDFAQFLSDPTCFLLFREGSSELMAFALWRVVLDEAELLTLATRSAARRQGLAESLLREGMRMARQRGARSCYLEVAAPNAAARALYMKLGFVQVGLRRAYYGTNTGNPVDAIVCKAVLER